ncbi:hypothetical protein LOC68_15565 [Blastopirellula sp. JC732]|uniref:Uncharacterized protein n=1 Tax=Blastopirellula sediminis TaxID=2894196 RepID=A0A9X1MP26_9BACT|nr:hypothetical protein [Blastopirellula sediminis]MCC9606897.1 hypothetical protein [Blastopirellula sediminis]MCC9629807.1 hypothetical protein [Blastopirellula sediminis]
MTEEINVLALVKGAERYIFMFNDSRRAETLRTLGRYASNPELSFSWYDAAVLSQKIRAAAPADEKSDAASSAVKPRFEFPAKGAIDIGSVDHLDFDEFE